MAWYLKHVQLQLQRSLPSVGFIRVQVFVPRDLCLESYMGRYFSASVTNTEARTVLLRVLWQLHACYCFL